MQKLNKKMMFAAWTCHNKDYFAYQTWHDPLKRLFKHFLTFDPQEYTYHHGREEMNRKFLEIVEKERPDYIFFWLIYEEFSLNTLFAIKKVSPKTKIVNFFGDDDVLFDTFSRYYSLFVDYPLVSHKNYLRNYAKEGIKNYFFSCGVDSRRYKPLKLKKKYDVSFIGIPKRDRVDLIRYLIDNGINVRVYGSGWENYPELQKFYGGHLSNENAINVINESKINLSFTKNYKGIPGFKARVFEICCCKSFLLSEYFSGYKEFLKENEEIIMFKTEKELLQKVKHYLSHETERERIASKAYTRVINNYSQEKEFQRIFSTIEKLNKTFDKKFPEVQEKVSCLSLGDLKLTNKEIKNKIKNSTYVSFSSNNGSASEYKNYFQIYSIEKTGKPISCCDYYVYSKILGNYLVLNAGYAFKQLKIEDFLKLFNIDQLLVKTSFFENNIEIFKSFEKRKKELVNDTSYISIPLLRLNSIKNLPNDKMEMVFQPYFENKLRSLIYRKKLFTNPFLYKLIIYSAIKRPYLLNRLIKRSHSKMDVISKFAVKTF